MKKDSNHVLSPDAEVKVPEKASAESERNR